MSSCVDTYDERVCTSTRFGVRRLSAVNYILLCRERRLYVSHIGTGAKVPGNESTRERKFHLWYFRSQDGTFALGSESTWERKFHNSRDQHQFVDKFYPWVGCTISVFVAVWAWQLKMFSCRYNTCISKLSYSSAGSWCHAEWKILLLKIRLDNLLVGRWHTTSTSEVSEGEIWYRDSQQD